MKKRLSAFRRVAAWPVVALAATLWLVACRPAQPPDGAAGAAADAPATPLPTRQTTIDPVNRKLDAAQGDAERRRTEVDQVGR